MDWTAIPHLAGQTDFGKGLLDLVILAACLVVVMAVIVGLVHAGRWFGREFRRGFDEGMGREKTPPTSREG